MATVVLLGTLDTKGNEYEYLRERVRAAGVERVVYTDVARDGMQVGPNVASTRALAEATAHPVIASGGVGTLAHVRELAGVPNIAAVIIGRALYERSFTIAEAVRAAEGTGR